MATLWDEIVFVEECNFVNDGRRFFIDEKDEEEYEISETDSSDFSSEFSEQEDTSSSEEESAIPTSVSGQLRKKSTKKQTTKKPRGKQATDKRGNVRGKKNKFLTKTELDEFADKFKIEYMQPVTKVTARIVPMTLLLTFWPR